MNETVCRKVVEHRNFQGKMECRHAGREYKGYVSFSGRAMYEGNGEAEKQLAVSSLHGGNGLAGVGAWKGGGQDAFTFSIDGSATFATV
ncbi:hypothetical protein ABGM91_07115 [Akkermansia muciniphila]|uniref:hypothetical protein n=1 Tax=Akkermansia muciniphila TaxID=239935 RepID=UPI0033AEC9E3